MSVQRRAARPQAESYEVGIHEMPGGTVSWQVSRKGNIVIHSEMEPDPSDWEIAVAYLRRLCPGSDLDEYMDGAVVVFEAALTDLAAWRLHAVACPECKPAGPVRRPLPARRLPLRRLIYWLPLTVWALVGALRVNGVIPPKFAHVTVWCAFTGILIALGSLEISNQRKASRGQGEVLIGPWLDCSCAAKVDELEARLDQIADFTPTGTLVHFPKSS